MRIYYGYHGGSSRSSLLIRPVLRELLKTAGSLAASKLNEQVCVSLSSMQTLQRSTWKVETCLKSCYQYAVVKTRCALKTLLRITPPYPAKWFWSLYVDFVFLHHTFLFHSYACFEPILGFPIFATQCCHLTAEVRHYSLTSGVSF